MRHTFSSEFLKVTPPATNFGEAWELLCFTLLRSETADSGLLRLTPPDRGVDILSSITGNAYQCKSSERGIFGSIDADDCINSLNTALKAQPALGWKQYSLAINGQLTGAGLGRINLFAASKQIQPPVVLPADYWAELCEKHRSRIEGYFDYRVFISEQEVVEALRKARYYDSVINAAKESLATSPLKVTVSNNRTPLLLDIPFSSDLTVEKLLDVAQELMGISLDWANYPDLGTSCGPSLSLTVDKSSLAFKTKLNELSADQLSRLQVWIKLIWKDELRKDKDHYDGTTQLFQLEYYRGGSAPQASNASRGSETLSRTEAIVQNTIWQNILARQPSAA